MKHNKLTYNWKWSLEFSWDMSIAEQLLKLRHGWTIRNHEYQTERND